MIIASLLRSVFGVPVDHSLTDILKRVDELWVSDRKDFDEREDDFI